MQQDIKERLLTKSPLALMFELSIPAIIGMLVIGLYPLMDGIFAGNIISQSAMTACTVILPLTFVNNGVATLIGIGSASILSRALGRNDKATIDKMMGNLIYHILLLSIIITIVGILIAPYFLDLVGANDEVKNLAIRYVRILFLGSIFVNFTQAANMIIRAEGLMKIAMAIMGFGALINIILVPIFMLLMGQYAIEGAAIATVLAQFIQAIITLNYFLTKSKYVKIGKIQKESEISKEMFAVGVSAMFMQVLFMIQQTLLYKQAFAYGGVDGGILMAATMRIYAFSFIPLWGMAQGLQPIVGANFGAKQYERVKQTMKIFCLAGLVLSAIFWIPAQIFAEQILSAFNINSQIIANGANNFRIFYSVFILYGVMILNITFFQAIGDAKKAGFIVIFRQFVLFVPAIIFLPKIFGQMAIWWAEPAVDFVMILVGFVMQQILLSKMR